MTVRAIEGGVEIAVRAQPRARSTQIAGPYGDRAVRIRVSAPPVDGAANEALEEFLVELFDVPRSHVEVIRGLTSRSKVVRIHGVDSKRARIRLGL